MPSIFLRTANGFRLRPGNLTILPKLLGSFIRFFIFSHSYAYSIGAFLLKEVVKLIDFILGYVTGMVITVLTLMFFMGAAGGKR